MAGNGDYGRLRSTAKETIHLRMMDDLQGGVRLTAPAESEQAESLLRILQNEISMALEGKGDKVRLQRVAEETVAGMRSRKA